MYLEVDAITGHYTIPGPTSAGSGGGVETFPIAPPSTVRGFLESLCGLGFEEMLLCSFRYGYRARPVGRGSILRKALVWSSSSGDADTLSRPLHYDTFFDVKYWVEVTQPRWVELLEKALRGEVERKVGGPLYLGESSDLVSCVRDVQELTLEDGACEVVPGKSVVMPFRSGRGYGKRNAVYKAWDLIQL